MSQAVTTAPAEGKVTFADDLERNRHQIAAVLPPHITADKFIRSVMIAVAQEPKLLNVNRRALFNQSLKCASDGLVPDGREAALVIFRKKIPNTSNYEDTVQYMPMVRGLVKMARNSGDISTVSANIVYENDKFEYVLGDDERMTHTPLLDGDRGKPKLAYATVTFKDGTKQREVLTMQDVAKIRAVSKTGDNQYGPWAQWFDEMAKKSALRRLLKYVSLSPDIQRAIDRDDNDTDFAEQRRAALRSIGGGETAQTQALAAIGNGSDEAEHDPETGEIADGTDMTFDVEACEARFDACQTAEDANALELEEIANSGDHAKSITGIANARRLRLQQQAGGRRK